MLDSDPVVVLNGDSFCRADFPSLCTSHQALGAEASLLLTRVPDVRRYGRVEIADDQRVLAFQEKGCLAGPGWINAGIYVLNRSIVREIPAAEAVSLERDVFPRLLGRRMFGHCGSGPFLDIGTPESYVQAERFFVEEIGV